MKKIASVSWAVFLVAVICGCGLTNSEPAAQDTVLQTSLDLPSCAGSYAGILSGDDQGNFNVSLTANGSFGGTALTVLVGFSSISGTVSADGQALGIAESGAIFEGVLDEDCVITGTWENGSFSGSWFAERITE